MIDDYDGCEWVNVSSYTGSPRLSRTKSGEPWNSCSVVVSAVSFLLCFDTVGLVEVENSD